MKYQVQILIDVLGPELSVDEPIPQHDGDQIVREAMALWLRYIRGHVVAGVKVQLVHPAKVQ